MLKQFMNWLDNYLDNRSLNQSAHYWAKQGSVTPYAEAELERFFRMKMEECRNFVCRRYLEDPTQILSDLKSEWIEENITPMLKSSFCKEDGKTLLAAITGMGEEVFVGKAAKMRRLEIDAAVQGARIDSRGIKAAQRNRAMRMI